MITQLHLSGNELVCYALIYGFSQDGETEFYGSLSYIASALNVTKQNAKAIIGRLQGKGLVTKIDYVEKGVKLCRYRAEGGVAESATGCCRNNNAGGVAESATIDNNELLFNTDSIRESVAPAADTRSRGAHLFKNSPYYEYEKFAAEFSAPEFAEIDLCYYYNCIRDWSQEGSKKKHDWIATARNWMRRDRDSGRLHKIPHAGLTPDAIQYLKDMAPSDFELGIRR